MRIVSCEGCGRDYGAQRRARRMSAAICPHCGYTDTRRRGLTDAREVSQERFCERCGVTLRDTGGEGFGTGLCGTCEGKTTPAYLRDGS